MADLAVALPHITFRIYFFITLVTLISGVLNANDRFWAAAAATRSSSTCR